MMARPTVRPKSLKVGFWNANGLPTRRFELQEFAERELLDVILVGETHLRASHNAKLPNYHLYRNDRVSANNATASGGVAAYVKSCIDHHETPTPCLTSIEAVSVVINTAFSGPVKFVSVYLSPSRNMDLTDMDSLLDSPLPVMIAGDLNAKSPTWNSRTTNTRGRALERYLDARSDALPMGPAEPTFHRTGALPDVLDIAILKDVSVPTDIWSIAELSSDHDPVIMTLNGDDTTPETVKLSRTSWLAFSQIVEGEMASVPEIHNPVELVKAVDNLTTVVRNAEQLATTSREAPVRGKLRLPPEILDLIAEKNLARRRWQRTRYPPDKKLSTMLQHKVRDAIRAFRDLTWEKKLLSLSTEDNSVWKMMKALKVKKQQVTPLTIPGRPPAISDLDRAEAFADSLELQCSPNPSPPSQADLHEAIINEVQSWRPSTAASDLREVTTDELQSYIGALKSKKAPGPDGVKNLALKSLPANAKEHVRCIINAALKLPLFPPQWRMAEVVMILKPGKARSDPTSYRPISLLSGFGKLLEKAILTRLQEEVDEKDLIPPEQHGFRSEHAASHQLVRVVEYITTAYNWKHCAGAVFLDVSKAFDKVWHEGLLWKLMDHEISDPLISIIASYLDSRSFRVRVGHTTSTLRPIRSGVPQGSILGPSLFNIYVSDMPMNEANSIMAQYADDTAILYRSKHPQVITARLQQAIDLTAEWFECWRIGINAEKSTAVLFYRRKKPKPSGSVLFAGKPIPWADQAKYLGVHLDRRLNFRTHFEEARKKAWRTFYALYPLLCRNSKLSLKNKLLLFKTVLRPIFTYASPAWGQAQPTYKKKLQVIQNKISRIITDAPWFVSNAQLHQDLELQTVADFCLQLSTKFFEKAKDHPNRIIKESLDYLPEDHFRHKKPLSAIN